jgi:ubiquinone biosynthesis protein Coq4
MDVNIPLKWWESDGFFDSQMKTLSKSDEHPYVHIYELDSLRRYPYRFQGHVIEKWIQRPPLEVFQKRKCKNPAISCKYEHIWTYAI